MIQGNDGIVSLILFLFLYGLNLLFIRAVAYSAAKEAIEDKQEQIRLIIREEIQSALKGEDSPNN